MTIIQKRNFGFDLVRALAVLMVITNHTMYLIYDIFPEFIANITMPFGDLGVVMFFVLSGYLIGDIFIKEIVECGKFSFSMLFNFIQRRWFRTVPNYLFFLGLYYSLYILAQKNVIDFSFAYWWDSNLNMNPDDQIFKMLFFLQNFFSSASSGFLGHTWSLSVEEWFYIIIPILAFILVNFIKLTFKYSLFSIIIFILIATPLSRFWNYYQYNSIDSFGVIFRMDQIMFGVLFAWLKNYYDKYFLIQKGVFTKIVLISVSYICFIKFVLISHPIEEFDIAYKSIFPFLFAYLLISLEVIDFNIPEILRRIITSISVYSYSMYLCHFLVTIFFIDYFYKILFFENKLAGFLLYIMFVFICFVWGKYQYRLFEKPITLLREKFSLWLK